MRTIAEIIEACGGAKAIAGALGRQDASFVLKWHRNGIPDLCWPAVMKLSNATAAELFEANDQSRRYAPSDTERGAA